MTVPTATRESSVTEADGGVPTLSVAVEENSRPRGHSRSSLSYIQMRSIMQQWPEISTHESNWSMTFDVSVNPESSEQ